MEDEMGLAGDGSAADSSMARMAAFLSADRVLERIDPAGSVPKAWAQDQSLVKLSAMEKMARDLTKRQDLAPLAPKMKGLDHSNRKQSEHWTKNTFNSSFPAALGCWMAASGIPAVYMKVGKADGATRVVQETIDMGIVYGLEPLAPSVEKPDQAGKVDDASPEAGRAQNGGAVHKGVDPERLKTLHFSFETAFEKYRRYVEEPVEEGRPKENEYENIDLVVGRVSDVKGGPPIQSAPLEVKLTVLPDSSTHRQPESEWCCELVVRPATTMYCALSMRDALNTKEECQQVRDIFKSVCKPFDDDGAWDKEMAIKPRLGEFIDAFSKFIDKFESKQKPFLMQPIWKTEGRQSKLCENAFDMFVWSDFALCRMFVELAKANLDKPEDADKDQALPKAEAQVKPAEQKLDRFHRCVVRMSRSLWELARNFQSETDCEPVKLRTFYTQMAYKLQTDKEFAIPGNSLRPYIKCERLMKPAVRINALRDIVEGGGHTLLSPERRLDATIFFNAGEIFSPVEYEKLEPKPYRERKAPSKKS